MNEDIYQDHLDPPVTYQNAESLGDHLRRGPSAHVQEVGRFPTADFYGIHRRHGQARPIDHASNVAIQGDVVQIALSRNPLRSSLFL